MSKKNQKVDIMEYRLEMIENRLSSIEHALLSKPDSSSFNTELLNIILGIIKQSNKGPHQTTDMHSYKESSEEPEIPSKKTKLVDEVFHNKSLLFEKRRAIV